MFALSRVVRSVVARVHVARAAAPAAVLPAAPVAAMSTRPSSRTPSFNGFYFSKAEACLNMRVIHPKYSQTGNNFMVLKQQGRLVFDIAPPASTGDGAGRAFDWKEKVGFSLSATELAQLAAAPFSGPLRFSHSYTDDSGAARQAVLSIAPEDVEGGSRVFVFTITHSASPTEPEKTQTIKLLPADVSLLKHMAGQSVVWVSGWMLNLDPTAYSPDLHLQLPAQGQGQGQAAGKPAPRAA